MPFTAQDVKTLREMTECGMLDCKKALMETDGDMEKAVEFLREKGLASVAKKAGRIAAEGVVLDDAEEGVHRPVACIDLNMGGGRIDGIAIADSTAILDVEVAIGGAQVIQGDDRLRVAGANDLQALAAVQVFDVRFTGEHLLQGDQLGLPDMHAVGQQHGQGVEDEQRQQKNQCQDGGDHHRISEEFLPFQRCTLTGFHGHSPLWKREGIDSPPPLFCIGLIQLSDRITGS